MEIPWLPPSANNAYFTLPKGIRVLTPKAKKFKAESATHLIRTYSKELMMFEQNKPYGVAITFTLPTMLNATWPDKAATRYKKIDTTNRVKLVEDVLAEVTNVDDSHYLISLLNKEHGPKEKITIWAWSIENEPGGLARLADGLASL
jgi:hypothetical protein